MGGRQGDIGQLVLEIADFSSRFPELEGSKKYFKALKATTETVEDFEKFEENCEELKKSTNFYAVFATTKGCLLTAFKTTVGAGSLLAGLYVFPVLATAGAPLIVFSGYMVYDALKQNGKTGQKLEQGLKCIEAPAVTWRWAINSYRKEIQERIEKFYGKA